MTRDEKLRDCLGRAGVSWGPLDESSHSATESAWRTTYGSAFIGRPRLRQGTKAEHAYGQLPCNRYFIVPFTSNVDGLPIAVRSHFLTRRRSLGAYECDGPLIPLGKFHDVEFFVCPTDFAWTMVHTHEDHGCGGPFFIRKEWLLSG